MAILFGISTHCPTLWAFSQILSAFRDQVEHMYFSHTVFAMRLHLMCHHLMCHLLLRRIFQFFSCLHASILLHFHHSAVSENMDAPS